MSAAGSALAQLKPFALNSRSLFVKCVPAPRSFYERRAVLAVLQRSSQQSIEIFKKLQDDSSFIVVTTRPDAAVALLDNSPLERAILSQGSSNDVISASSTWSSKYEEVSGPIAAPINLMPADVAASPSPASAQLGLSYKTFTLHIFPTNEDYDHPAEIRKNPLYGKWPGNGKTETFISTALQKVIPSGAMAPALRDWETGNQLATDGDSFADDGPEGAASLLFGKKRVTAREAFLMERIRRRRTEQETPKVMSSLYKFAEECKTKAEEAQSDPSWDTAPKGTSSAGEPDPLLDDSTFKKLLED
ncbi:hypothetical protein F4803DRAFT_63142 [Xylaria telfairii]|nr:hypothetical protein F4803DRAFT_63142 [Xylaria telfairii]